MGFATFTPPRGFGRKAQTDVVSFGFSKTTSKMGKRQRHASVIIGKDVALELGWIDAEGNRLLKAYDFGIGKNDEQGQDAGKILIIGRKEGEGRSSMGVQDGKITMTFTCTQLKITQVNPETGEAVELVKARFECAYVANKKRGTVLMELPAGVVISEDYPTVS